MGDSEGAEVTESTPPLGTQAAAQAWHDQQVNDDPGHEQFSSCCCCCQSCDPDWGGGNPYFAAASKRAT